jgi:hypothetical protein
VGAVLIRSTTVNRWDGLPVSPTDISAGADKSGRATGGTFRCALARCTGVKTTSPHETCGYPTDGRVVSPEAGERVRGKGVAGNVDRLEAESSRAHRRRFRLLPPCLVLVRYWDPSSGRFKSYARHQVFVGRPRWRLAEGCCSRGHTAYWELLRSTGLEELTQCHAVLPALPTRTPLGAPGSHRGVTVLYGTFATSCGDQASFNSRGAVLNGRP